MFKDSSIYVAGHTGLLGTSLLERLMAGGFRNLITRTRDELDLTDRLAVESFFADVRPEFVFLCAGLTGGIVANKTYPATFMHTNLAIQDSVFEAAWKYDAKGLVFYGSSCVYPRQCPNPMKEEHFLTGPIEQTSEAYAIAKMAGIIACKSYNVQYGATRYIALVPNSMYGPNDNFGLEHSHVLAALIRKFHDAKTEGLERVTLWGSGSPRREFVFSADAADASVFAMLNADKMENTHYNVGSGEECSISELAGLVSGIVGFEGEIEWDRSRPDGTPRKLLDSQRFMSLGWRAGTSLDEGLRKTYEWYLNNQQAAKGV